MKQRELGSFDVSRTNISDSVFVDYKGPISVQVIPEGVVGDPTVTLYVSNDNDFYERYDKVVNVPIASSLELICDPFLWKYLKFVISSGTSGTVKLIVAYDLN